MDKETTAIVRLQDAAEISERLYQKPLLLTYSGGKDSDVMLHLADAAGIDYEVEHSLTTADSPETVWHTRKTLHRLEDNGIKCTVDIHRKPDGSTETMWNLIPHKMIPPTRSMRYCCAVLKETGGKGRFTAIGVRWAESIKRRSRQVFEISKVNPEDRIGVMSMDNDEDRRVFEACPVKGERSVAPIIDWSDSEVWDYIRAEKIELNPLYECGFERVGCIGCPLAGRHNREREFAIWPKYKENYIRAFDRMLDERRKHGKTEDDMRWGNTGEDVFHWWMNDDTLPGQTSLWEV